MRRLLIVGGGGHGKVVADTAREMGVEAIAFADDKYPALRTVEGLPVIGTTADVRKLSDSITDVVVAIGNNRLRVKYLKEFRQLGLSLATLVHPRAFVSRTAQVGSGTVIFAQAAVNAAAVLGLGVIINTAASVDHDCVLGDGVHLSPGAHLGGSVTVGENTWVGVGAAVINDITIGSDSLIGAGAAIVRDVADKVTVVGIPGRVIKHHG